MKYYQIPYLRGVVKDIRPRLIPDEKASSVENILFKEMNFQPRWGYATYGGNLPLNGSITGITLFRKNNSDKILCAFTKRDAYYLEQSTGLWKYFTRIFSDGAVTISTGSLNTVTLSGSGITWDSTNWDALGVYQIKFGDNDPNTSGTWHTVKSVDSTTQITLSENAPAITGSDYVLRLCFSGTDTDYHSFAYPYDATVISPAHTGEEDKILVVVNGVDEMQYWTGDIGTDYLEVIENSLGSGAETYIAKYVDFFGSSGFGHTILSYIVEGTDTFPQRIQASNSGHPFEWGNSEYNFYDSQDEIVGIRALQDRFILYKSESMTEVWINVTGGNVDPFNYRENKIRDIGTPSIRTVHDFGSFHIFLSWDNVYIFDGVSVTPIGTDLINTMIQESNRAFLSNAFALPILSESLYCLFIPTGEREYPDTCFVYNYRERFWTIWDLTHTISNVLKAKMTAQGYVFKESSPVWSSYTTTEIEVTGNVTSGSDQLTITSYPAGYTYADIVEGMQVIGTGVGTGDVGHHVSVDASSDTITLTGNAVSSVTGGTFTFYNGTSWEDLNQRWIDLLIYEDNMSYLLGDSDGYIYNISPEFTNDQLDVSGTTYNEDIDCDITTKDYPLNNPKNTIKVSELVIGMTRFSAGSLRIRASIDFGTTWSDWVTIPNTAETGDSTYVEHIANIIQRGRQVRFQMQNVDGADFEIESLLIGYNEDSGRIIESNT